ncbi:hypothetical protein C5167_002763 [Papaver somniferum]|uniref:PHD-type domain-containing protein n=1 Tax=Papaver somniferum TaxID=3469 RepID=A0A4Y7KZ35_PAPSO|nr:hypothetical protein C5167_002763 [Papaver somniferum]
MAFPKLVGFSFGVEEQTFSSVNRQNGFENEDRRRNSILGHCSSSPVWIETSSSSSSSSLEFALGINGRKEDVGGGYFSLHESFSGSSKDVNEKEGVLGFRNLNVNMGGNGMPEISKMSKQVIHDGGSDRMQKNKAFTKCVSPRGDHTWLPKQGNSISSSVSKRMKPNKSKNRKPLVIEDEDMGVSESDIQNMANPNSLKSILLSCGWMVVAQEGRDASYVSPSGSIYGSLQKALEVFSRDASKFAERQCCFSQSVVSFRDNVAQRTPKIKRKSTSRRTRTVVQPIAENAALREKSSVQVKCLTGVIIELDSSDVEVGQVTANTAICTTGIQQGDKILGGETIIPERIYDMKMKELGERTSKPVEKISMPEEVHLVVMDKKLKSCTKDEGLSVKKHASNCLGLTEITNNHNGSAVYLNRERQVQRRSVRIKGRRVPVDDELMGVWFDEYMKTGLPGPENMKYRQVTELLASSMGEEKVDKKSGIGASAYPEEMAFGELHREKAKSCNKDDCSSNETNWSKWINEVATNGQSGNSKLQLDCDFTRARRSKSTKRRHIPVGCEANMGMSAYGKFPRLSRILGDRAAEEKETTSSSNLFEISFGNKNEIETPLYDKPALPLKKNSAKTMTIGKYLSYRSKRKPVSSRCSNEKEKTKRSGGCSLTVRTRNADFEDTPFSETKLTILSWLIDSGVLAENTKVVYRIEKDQRITLTGRITRAGIWCNCCRMVLSLSKFEVHAGSNLRRPWTNIRLISGKSLMQCHSEAWEKEKRHRKFGFQVVGIGDADPSDDTCGICADGGNLLCCDGCPSTFHQECLMLEFLPEGSWYCPYCSCRFCSRGDRWHDKSYRAMSLASCNHCGCKYHRDCVTKNDVDSLGTNSQAYCGKLCKEVASGLSDILGVSNPISGGFSWVLVKHLDEVEGTDSKRTQSSMMECHARLPLALLALHECFVPLIDPRSSLDMITQAVYNCGSNYKRLNYEGFYTVILEKDDEIISVATIRFAHGIYLFNMLSKLHVENLILPATPDMLGTWTKSFSFQHLALSCKNEFRNLNIVQFADTTILQKSIHCGRDVKQFGVTDTYTQDVLNCSTPEYRIQGYKVATLGLREEMKASTSTHETPFPILLEASRGSGFDVYPVQSPLYQNINKNSLILESKSTTLAPVDNIIMTKVSLRPETVSLGSRNLLMSEGC